MTSSGLGTMRTCAAKAAADDSPQLDTIEVGFDECASSLYRYFVVRTCGDAHRADDFMQQLWLRANNSNGARKPQRLEEVEPWLRTIAANLIRAHWRQSLPRAAADQQAARMSLADRLAGQELPPATMEKGEVQQQLLLALTELPSADQALLLEHYFHGRSQRALAQSLGISVRAVEGRLYRARHALRAKLAELES